MRELSKDEVDAIAGGNLVALASGSIQLTSAYGAGYLIGAGVNYFNENVTGMSLGEAVYYSLN